MSLPIYVGTAGLSFGFVSAETGGLLQNLEVRQTREKAMVRDTSGRTVGKVYFDPSEEISLEFFPSSASGLGAASVGVALTLANYTPTSGAIYPDEVTTTRSNSEYRKQTIKATVHPSIS